MNIRTNHKPRELLYATDVPDKILSSQFDYQDADQRDSGYGYICYQKIWYHLDQFTRCQADSDLALLGYTAYYGDSFYSGVLIKLLGDDRVVMATYTS